MRLHVPILASLLLLSSLASDAQTTNVRLLATSLTKYNGSNFSYCYDSTRYRYAGAHALQHIDWDRELKYMKYDTLENIVWNNALGKYELNYTKQQKFNSVDSITNTQAYKNDNGNIRDDGSIRYGYDANNKLSYEVSRVYDIVMQVVENKDSAAYTYDANGRLKEVVVYNWKSSTTQWEPFSKAVTDYDGNGNNDYYVFRLWDAGSFKDVQVIINTFNGNNELVTSLEKRANTPGSTAINYQRHSYAYQSGMTREYTVEQWDDRNGIWINFSKTTYVYSGSDISVTTVQGWDGLNSVWENTTRTQYTYYSPQLLRYKTELIWDGSGFINNERTHYAYNSMDLLTVETHDTWNVNSGIFEYKKDQSEQKRYFYAATWPLDIANSNYPNEGINIYPVPANDRIVINGSFDDSMPIRCTIRSIDGRVVEQWQEVANRTQFSHSITHLQAGVYLLSTCQGGEYNMQRFVVSH